jgi:hypothetical protein
MGDKIGKTSTLSEGNYDKNYLDLPFENVLREFRKNNVLKIIAKYNHRSSIS